MDETVIGCDLYNQTLTNEVACSLTASMEVAGHSGPKVIILNDQGGSVMDVGEKVNCLRAQDHGHPGVICFEPGIAKREGGGNRFVADKSTTLRAEAGDNKPAVCFPINLMVATRGGRDDMRTCFGIGQDGEPQYTLSSAHEHAVCYAIEGNTVDRQSQKNGKGWCENVSPTLNTQDKHAVIYGVDCRNGCIDEEKTHTIQAKPGGGISLNCTPSVVYSLEGNGSRPSHMGNGYSCDGMMYTINTIEKHGVCYSVENHPQDSRVNIREDGICQTIPANAGTGGNNVPLVLMRSTDESISNDNRSTVRQDGQRTFGTGRIQRYAPGLQEE